LRSGGVVGACIVSYGAVEAAPEGCAEAASEGSPEAAAEAASEAAAPVASSNPGIATHVAAAPEDATEAASGAHSCPTGGGGSAKGRNCA